MSIETQQPPLRPGDRVRYIYDLGHLEVVKCCKLVAGAAMPHWRVVTAWDGAHRVADAAEFVIEGAGP
jgi:hypothetical protein